MGVVDIVGCGVGRGVGAWVGRYGGGEVDIGGVVGVESCVVGEVGSVDGVIFGVVVKGEFVYRY